MKLTARLLCLTAVMMVTACSDQPDLPATHSDHTERHVYGKQEKRIAQLLSIGETGVKLQGSPQDQALLCDIALQAMSDQLRESGALSDVQMRAFAKIQALYRQRAAEGRSKAQMASSRQDLEAAHSDDAQQVRVAIGCLRDLND